jgi:hypothetical protein
MSGFYYLRELRGAYVIDAPTLRNIDAQLHALVTAEHPNMLLRYDVVVEDASGGNLHQSHSNLDAVLATPNSKGNRVCTLGIGGGSPVPAGMAEPEFDFQLRVSEGMPSPRISFQMTDRRTGKDHQQVCDKIFAELQSTQRDASTYYLLPKFLGGTVPAIVLTAVLLIGARFIPQLHSKKVGDLSVVDFPIYLFTLVFAIVWLFTIGENLDIPKVLEKKWPVRAVFLWGAEVHDYPRRMDIHKNIFWTIVIGFPLSLIGGVLLWLALPTQSAQSNIAP